MCEMLNNEMLSRISSDEIKLFANDALDCPNYLKKKIRIALETDVEDCSRSGGLPKIIKIKIGAKIMLTRNVDVTQGLINGTIGIVSGIKTNIDEKKIYSTNNNFIIKRNRTYN